MKTFAGVYDPAVMWAAGNGTFPRRGLEFTMSLKGPMICTMDSGVSSRGIFYEDNPLQKSSNVFMLQIILLILAHRIVYFLLRPLKQTKFVCSVLAGILIGPQVLGRLHVFGKKGLFPEKEMVTTSTVASLGIVYFIFLVAVKMDVMMLHHTAKRAITIGSLSVIVPFAATVGATFLHPLSGNQSGMFRLLFASGMSVTRFANAADAFDELDLLTCQQSQLVLSAAMLSEVFTWLSLIAGICYRHRHISMIPAWILFTVVSTSAVAFALRVSAAKVIRKLNRKGVLQVNEMLITSIMVIALLTAFLTDLIGSLHLGILIMGLILPDGPPLGSAITGRAEYMVKEFLMPVFYVLVGYSTDISSVHWKDFVAIAEFIGIGFCGKFLAAMIGALACRYDLPNAVMIGLMLNVKGPIDLYLLMRWKNQKDVTEATHAILVLWHILITAAVTPLIQKLYADIEERAMWKRKSIRAIQTSSNYEEFRIICCVHGMDNVPGIISLLEASNGRSTADWISPISAVVVHLNDLVGRAAPVVVRNDKQERRIQTNKSDAIAHEFESYTRRSDNPVAGLRNFTVVAPYKTMHENVCHIAQAEAATLIVLPYWKKINGSGAGDGGDAGEAAIRHFNCHVLGCNPCAVGILVNKGLGRCMGSNAFAAAVHVAVIFTGGQDDREALAYAERMMAHPMVHVTLLKLLVRCPREYVEDMLEKKLDDAMVQEFRARGMDFGCGRAEYYEDAAVDPMGTMDAIRRLGDHYNLVITGRQSSLITSMFERSLDTMTSWGDDPELGIIGDFIASEDYNGGKTSALIMHRYPSKMTESGKRPIVDYYDECLLVRSV
ncbi:hypothetical protein SAY87_018550 [Trapa incisa]|uniref:Cation/H+ exchanger domain-containing protein n=1 Tax=Trapa incisa TaxID=236973 RepID=A0AAN7KXT2_9MYRT|nr:hypothetical protein SAY87_018550 [Trapa incisa]